jgi:dihydropyrimidine dehydrogenase (NAD+) subunit PreT
LSARGVSGLNPPELHPPFAAQAAVVEANRCLNCFDAPCAGACPTHINVPQFIKKIAGANLMGSARTILDANVLGLSCGRVCPVEVLCEGACVLHNRGEKPIEIGRLQRHAMDYFYAHDGKLPQAAAQVPKRVACIGAGPASLACAAELRMRGVSVTLFDKHPMAGGLITYGVAQYKFTPEDTRHEIDLVRALGVEFRNRIEIGRDISVAELERDFDAIFVGVGLGATLRLDIPGEQLSGVYNALDFIAAYKNYRPLPFSRNVAVIGGGNTAIDAALAARMLGAEEVTVLYRRLESDMSAFAQEYEMAKREGVRFLFHARPVAFAGQNHVEGVRCESGAYVKCDTVIIAIGQLRLLEMLERVAGLHLSGGLVEVNSGTGQTANPKYFAGGDCVNGGREVVDAVAAGKRAARGIIEWLT